MEIRAGAEATRGESASLWLPMRANGATREFSVSRGNSRTKRREVNWCRVDCFCVADWKARIPPSGNFLKRGEEETEEEKEEEWRSDRSVFAFARARYSKTTCCCARCLPRLGCLVNSAQVFPLGQVSNVARALCLSLCGRGLRERPFLFLEKARSMVIRLEFPPSTSKAGRNAEHFRFPLE